MKSQFIKTKLINFCSWSRVFILLVCNPLQTKQADRIVFFFTSELQVNVKKVNMTKYNGIDTSRTNLIVNYLPQTMTDKELFSMFVTIGPVESCRVMKNHKVFRNYSILIWFCDCMRLIRRIYLFFQVIFHIYCETREVTYDRPVASRILHRKLTLLLSFIIYVVVVYI